MSLRAILMSAAGASDTLPDSFTFPSTSAAEVSTSYTSSYVPVNYDEATWTVTGGQGSTDNVNFATSGKITKGQTFYIKATSSSSFSTTTTASATFSGYVTATYSITTRVADTVPDAFSFTNVSNAELNTSYTASTVPAGYDNAGWSVSGGQGSTDNVNFAASGSITKGQTFYVKSTSSGSYSTQTSTTVNIGTTTTTWYITTKVQPDPNPDAFSFTNVSNAELNTPYTSSVTPTGYNTSTSWSVTGGTGSIDGSNYAASGTISPGQTFYVKATSSGSYSTQTSASVSIGTTSTTWYITTKVAPDTTPDQFTFSDVSGANLNTITYTNLTPTGYNTSTSWSVTGGTASTDNASWASLC